VLFEVALDFTGREVEVAAYLVPHHLLGNDLIPNVRLKVLKRNTLLHRRLLQILHSRQVVLLADFVESVDQIGFAVDPQFLAFGEPELLIDEVAQEVLVQLRDLLHGSAVLAGLFVNFLGGPFVIGARDDLVVDAGDDVFHRDAAVGAGRFGGTGLRQSGGCKQHRAQHGHRGNAKES